ncbi:hypothetical protein ZWY2020_025064 [Hordeum vulgare]|nr:hypothetical protein ZWY2020_025064 [Hordeum vulgare]
MSWFGRPTPHVSRAFTARFGRPVPRLPRGAIKADTGPVPVSTNPTSSLPSHPDSLHRGQHVERLQQRWCAAGRRLAVKPDRWPYRRSHPLGMYMPPSSILPRLWRISVDGYPTLGPPTSREELWRHPNCRYNRKGRCRFWRGKSFDDVIRVFKRATRGVPVRNIPWDVGPSRRRTTAPAIAGPPALPEVLLLSEQAAMDQDDDPHDTRGLLAARTAAEEALDEERVVAVVELAVALEAVEEEDVWLLSSTDNNGGDAAFIDFTEED